MQSLFKSVAPIPTLFFSLVTSSPAVVALIIMALATPASAMPVYVTESQINIHASDGSSVTETSTNTMLPANFSLSATTGNSSSIMEANWSGDAGSALFSFDMQYVIDNSDGTGNDNAGIDYDYFTFTALTNSTYTFSGTYEFTSSRDNSFIRHELWFIDLTAYRAYLPAEKFYGFKHVFYTMNGSLSLGQDVANEADHSINGGSLTGFLQAGHEYQFQFSSLVQAFNPYDGSTTYPNFNASENLTLHIISAVPLPAAAWLFGSGLLGLLGWMKRKTA